MNPITVVLIEDEVQIRRLLKASMKETDVRLLEAENGADGVYLVAHNTPDVVLLDLGLPDLDGLDVLLRIREWSDVPIIVLSARGQERDKVLALDRGADDYVTKPFTVGELMARIRVSLRRSKKGLEELPPVFSEGGLVVDFEKHQVSVDGAEVHLTPIEFKLVALLARHAGKVLTHNHILREVWGPAYEDSTHTLRVHMATIRQKIERDPAHLRFIKTETGIGYRMIVR